MAVPGTTELWFRAGDEARVGACLEGSQVRGGWWAEGAAHTNRNSAQSVPSLNQNPGAIAKTPHGETGLGS